MFQYEYEKRPHSSSSCASQATTLTSWDPPTTSRPPLPPRPRICQRMPSKTTVPLKVWVIASASCFAVCAALVLATVVITKWGSSSPYTRQILEEQDLVYSNPHPIYITQTPADTDQETTTNNELDPDMEIIEKLSIFKNVVAPRVGKKDLLAKPQIHPAHDTAIEHAERKIEKKDKPKLPEHLDVKGTQANTEKAIPDFKPTLPDIFSHGDFKLPDGYLLGLRKPVPDYEEYYSDDNLYEDYMQSNTMTNYLIEKVQELHDWINSDPDFESVKNVSRIARNGNDFTEVLQALNQSLLQGNVSIIMLKLKDIYFDDAKNTTSHGRKMIVSNSTNLLSFGILTLDIMLLHNIQLMAWENQEAARIKMLKDPDVFAFNALFMEPAKIEAKQNEINAASSTFAKRQGLRQDSEELDIGSSLLDNLLDIGISTTRAALHLGRAYKNTKAIISQIKNRDNQTPNHSQLSRNIDGNTQALNHVNHIQTSFGGGVANGTYYTELDCLWLLYCKNLVATSKLHAPYGTMARINGMALRMLTGEVPAERALQALVEALHGGTDLPCDRMLPRCSKANAASVVLNSILQPLKKS